MSNWKLCGLASLLKTLTVSYLSAGSPTTAHRNLTSNSLSDFSDKPEKDQVNIFVSPRVIALETRIALSFARDSAA